MERRRREANPLAGLVVHVLRLPNRQDRAAVEDALTEATRRFPEQVRVVDIAATKEFIRSASDRLLAGLDSVLRDDESLFELVRSAAALAVSRYSASMIAAGEASSADAHALCASDPPSSEALAEFERRPDSPDAMMRFARAYASALSRRAIQDWTLPGVLAAVEARPSHGPSAVDGAGGAGSRRLGLDAVRRLRSALEISARERLEVSPGADDREMLARAFADVVSAQLTAAAESAAVVDRPLNVRVDLRSAGVHTGGSADFSIAFPPGVGRLVLAVQLTSSNVDIRRPVLPLVMRRDGTSEAPAEFTVTPRSPGPTHLTATLQRDGSMVAQVSFSLEVAADDVPAPTAPGSLIPVSSVGRALDAAQIDTSQFLGLTFTEVNGRFRCVVSGDAHMEADLDVTREDLNSAVLNVRRVLLRVSHDTAAQNRIGMDGARTAEALLELAEAGILLFRKLFYLRPQNTAAQAIGDTLVELLAEAEGSRRIQFAIRGLAIPWHALYLAATLKGEPRWDRFIGFRHVIEEVILNSRRTRPVISVEDGLSVGLHVDPRIDEEQGIPAVANQEGFWRAAMDRAPAITFAERTKNDELRSSLGASSGDQVLAFLCHAGLGTTDGGDPIPDDSWLQLSEDPVTVGQLTLWDDTSSSFEQGPLVFLNACQSTAVSPQFSVNFATYFLDRGARTVIGTECDIATVFADEFGRAVFGEILRGVTVGAALLAVRTQMLERGNPLGLAYGLHGASGTRLIPGLLDE
ncbi:CHAT domain-containing protein [Microbacterium sp. NPDC058062]|uniref:CHAT domain-containing protein n=1 Tax=Microbacterium sp. NPDC058062 TaxID=3346320 RepID=UPI0036DD48B7